MNAKIQMAAENITAGMKIIPAGAKKPVEVISADNWNNEGRYQFGCMGKGFSVHSAAAGELVTVAM